MVLCHVILPSSGVGRVTHPYPVNFGFMQLALANAALLDVSCAEAEASVTWALQR